ncbi:MAG TPA: M14 family metallopeptidase [Vicinamibacterales bacterium]|nr:M14 family metallopeptidase [Vicinamibacterales bacterium]
MTRLSTAILFTLAVAAPAAAQQPFTVGPVTAQPGTTASGTIEIAARAGDQGTIIPISVVHGAKPGPVLALVAGVHGMEYTPILALQNLRASIDPKTLTGTVIMVHVANMPSFLGRTIYYSPADGQNLNRVFPGKADGTLSERIAYAITREVIERATHLVDLHCGDGNESLRPYTYWITTGRPEVAEAGRQMALAFGMPHIIVDRERPSDPAASMYVSNTAITRHKPALTIESGGMGEIHTDDVLRIERGVAGLLKHLGMRADGPPPVTAPILLERAEVLRSSVTGIFYPMVDKMQTVAEGTVIGRITDFHGKLLEEIKAPFAGEVMYVIGTPAMNKGEPVAYIAATKAVR